MDSVTSHVPVTLNNLGLLVLPNGDSPRTSPNLGWMVSPVIPRGHLPSMSLSARSPTRPDLMWRVVRVQGPHPRSYRSQDPKELDSIISGLVCTHTKFLNIRKSSKHIYTLKDVNT